MPPMLVHVRLFAGTRDAVGAGALDVELPEGARVADLFARLAREHPRLAAYRGHVLLALDGAFVAPDAPLRGGAEVAIMPPVSGGASAAVGPEPFSLDALVAEASKGDAGAVVAFTGVVRPTSGERPGARVARLRFEAYAPMAERVLDGLRAEAVAKFGLTGCELRHRVGVLEVGEPIVAVVAAAPHRRDAFEAAAWLMDELKARAPVWKREEDAEGRGRWVNDPTAQESASDG